MSNLVVTPLNLEKLEYLQIVIGGSVLAEPETGLIILLLTEQGMQQNWPIDHSLDAKTNQ